mgnify:CR=1 FL=1
MMSRTATVRYRDAWQDRWSKPTLDDLLGPHKVQTRKVLEHLMEHVDGLPNVQQKIIWYGNAWKWTLQYTLHDAKGREVDTLCYVVPRTEQPLVSVPLSEQQIGKLPIRRLPKIVREGIRSAKFALTTHWANWTPNLVGDTNQIFELLKRKHKMVLQPSKSTQNAEEN